MIWADEPGASDALFRELSRFPARLARTAIPASDVDEVRAPTPIARFHHAR